MLSDKSSRGPAVEQGRREALRRAEVADVRIGEDLPGVGLDRRIGDITTLRDEVRAWQDRRNAEGVTIRWLFSVEKARAKMARAYPKLGDAPGDAPLSGAAICGSSATHGAGP